MPYSGLADPVVIAASGHVVLQGDEGARPTRLAADWRRPSADPSPDLLCSAGGVGRRDVICCERAQQQGWLLMAQQTPDLWMNREAL